MKRHLAEQSFVFASLIKWIFLSSLMGVVIGALITLFLKVLSMAEGSRELLPFPYYFTLPFALVLTVYVIKKLAPKAEGHGTEKVIEAIHKNDGKIDIAILPVKVVATVISIFSGASVGKEGPAAQLGAAASSYVSDLFRFNAHDRKKLVICGISAGFASVFGTPIAGAIFGIEILIVGTIMYDVLLPSIIAGFVAFLTADYLGVEYSYFALRNYYTDIPVSLYFILLVILAGLFFGIVTDIFVTVLNAIQRFIRELKWHWLLKPFVAGLLIALLAYFFGDRYLGLGFDIIRDSLSPYDARNHVLWYDTIGKMFFTALSLGGGASGGIITPVFFIGAAAGNLFGHIVGGEHIAFFAALGFVSVVAGATNAPIAAIIMAGELFGLEVAHYAAVSVVISFLMTGHRSVFPSQILAMKKSQHLKIKLGKEIENVEIDYSDEKYIRGIKDIKERMEARRKLYKKKKNKSSE
ncbi:MAG: chloride channel protein [Campylobacterota bacterium]|nr:chloride channel protein [Campylobacterota bacterium]